MLKKEGAQASDLRILQQEIFAEDIKSLKAEKETQWKANHPVFTFIDQQGNRKNHQGRMEKSHLNFKTKHPILLHWNHNVIELPLRNEHKKSRHEATEHVRNTVQQKLWILGMRNALRSIKSKCIRCRKGRVQAKDPVITDLPKERLVASTVFSNVGVDYFGRKDSL